MRLSRLPAVVLVALALGGCGATSGHRGQDGPGASTSPRRPEGMPTTIPSANGVVRTRSHLAVLSETGKQPELCFVGLTDSDPQHCSHLDARIAVDWSGHQPDPGARVEEYLLTGRFDGKTFTVASARRWSDDPERAPVEEPDEFATRCPEPPGGWRVVDPAKTTRRSVEALESMAQKLPGYTAYWVDTSRNPAEETGSVRAANDPRLLTVNVMVDEDVAGARRTLRAAWGGALCVSRSRHSQAEAAVIEDEVSMLPGLIQVSADRDAVDVDVLYDDGSFARWADARFGRGYVRISSALVPASG